MTQAEFEARVVEMYTSGMTVTDIRLSMGVRFERVVAVFEKHDLPRRKRKSRDLWEKEGHELRAAIHDRARQAAKEQRAKAGNGQ